MDMSAELQRSDSDVTGPVPAKHDTGDNDSFRPSRSTGLRFKRLFKASEAGILVALVIMVAVIGSFRPAFLESASLINVGQQSAFFGIMTLGMVFLISMREIDLSVGSNFGLCAVAGSVLIRDGIDPWVGAVLTVLLGVALGATNATLVNVLRIPTIIVTLGTLSVFRGLSLVISDTRTVSGLPRDHQFFQLLGGRPLGVPVSVWAFVIMAIVLHAVYTRTRFGYVVRSIGSNPDAAELTGMLIGRTRFIALSLVGGLCGLAGALNTAFFVSADPNTGTGSELLVIAATIIGGTALAGGAGSVIGGLLGALMIAVIRSGLIQFSVSPAWSVFATGAVIILAVALDTWVRQRQRAQRGAGT